MSDAFRGRPVLLTGHTGFKGAWLALCLHRLGAAVHGYALPPDGEPNLYAAAGVGPLLAHDEHADLRDAGRLAAAVNRADPAVIFHLAARALVRDSYEHPREAFEVNVLGTVNLLEAVRRRGRPCVVVVVTSDKCYENRERTWGLRECDPLGGSDPYSASKAACEIAAASYRSSYFGPKSGVRLATVRAGNVIGGGDWSADRIVPDLARGLGAGRAVAVRNPRSVRPWQHVLDPLAGYLLLAGRMLADDDPKWCDAWNFGPTPGDECPVAELADAFCAAWGGGRWQDASDPSAPPEAKSLRLCVDKARAELGWRPRWGVREAVARSARWYRRFAAEGGAREMCLREIDEHHAGGA